MNRLFVAAAALFAAISLSAQPKQAASPAENASATIAGHTISIKYSSPGVKGREGKIFGKDGLISHDPHYPVWRAGANAATTLTTNTELKIGDLVVPAGSYTLFVDISDPDQWQLILSKKTGEWGLAYDTTQDLGRVKMKMTRPTSMVENLTWSISALSGPTGQMSLAWENHSASVLFAVH